MSFLSWLFGSQTATATIPHLHGRGRFTTEVTDCDLHQPALEKICIGFDMEDKPLDAEVTLIELPYDPANRHPVQVEIHGKVIGHLCDRDAKKFLHKLHRENEGTEAICPGRIYFHPDPGPNRPAYTVRLDLLD